VDDLYTGIQIGLRANQRFSPVPLPNNDNIYQAQPGESGPGLPTWNYDIHIDMRGTGLSFDDVLIEFTTNVANHSSPNLQAGLETAFVLTPGSLNGVELFQTSVNPGFFASGIDPFAKGVYDFKLTVTPNSGSPAFSAAMAVNVVPMPGALPAGLALLSGLALVRRRRRCVDR